MENETSITYLASALRTVATRLVKKLRNKSETGAKISLTERSTLSLLDEHKQLLPGELAAMEKITSQSMSQILNHLFELGFIDRRMSETDGRKVLISLSKAGQQMLNKFRSERDEWLAAAIAQTCNAKEQALLLKMMGPLTKLVDFD
jgi:DNA-binding MarR family transcriptional regulator